MGKTIIMIWKETVFSFNIIYSDEFDYTTFSSDLLRAPSGNNCWHYTETWNKFDTIMRSNPPRMWYNIIIRRKKKV